MRIIPKRENQDVGFYYEVSDEQIIAHQKKSVSEILEWVETTAKFIHEMQSPEERERMKLAKNYKW